MVELEAVGAAVAGSPSGFATVAPWEALGAALVEAVGELEAAGVAEAGSPSGFATVAPCETVEVAGVVVTVAESTFAVTFGAPAELVVGKFCAETAAGVGALAADVGLLPCTTNEPCGGFVTAPLAAVTFWPDGTFADTTAEEPDGMVGT